MPKIVNDVWPFLSKEHAKIFKLINLINFSVTFLNKKKDWKKLFFFIIILKVVFVPKNIVLINSEGSLESHRGENFSSAITRYVEYCVRNWTQSSRRPADGDTPSNKPATRALFRGRRLRVSRCATRRPPAVARCGRCGVRVPRSSSQQPGRLWPLPPAAAVSPLRPRS